MPAQMVVTLRGSPHHPLNGGVRRRRRRSQPGSQPATMGEVLHLRAGLHRLAGRFDSFREELEEQRRLQQRAERFGVSLGRQVSSIAASQAEMMRLLQDIAGDASRVAAFSPSAPGDDGSSSSSSSGSSSASSSSSSSSSDDDDGDGGDAPAAADAGDDEPGRRGRQEGRRSSFLLNDARRSRISPRESLLAASAETLTAEKGRRAEGP